MALSFPEIDQERRSRGISVHALCEMANVSPLTYKRLKTRKTKRPQQRTLSCLEAALGGVVQPREVQPDPLRKLFYVVLAVCAQAAGLPNLDAIAVDPHANRPRDLNWIALMRLRQVAIYVVNAEAGVRASHLAKALGVSKQAISKALRAIEDRRDDPAFDSLLNRIGELMKGREAA